MRTRNLRHTHPMNLRQFPGFWITLFTIGIARARWVDATNHTLGRGGAGFWFAWFLAPFAYYGVAGRMNDAMAAVGSTHKESPLACFFLVGWPFIGTKKRLRRGVNRFNDVHRVGQRSMMQPPVGGPA
ncbi:MAG: hypothetical protein JWO15_3858 [Sphingomonadales bacterium]|nr:hypothetical protein [Sphingomonadales bacterium]